MNKVTSVLHVFNEVLPLANTTAKELELLLKFMLLALYGYLIHGLRLDFELSHGTQLWTLVVQLVACSTQITC